MCYLVDTPPSAYQRLHLSLCWVSKGKESHGEYLCFELQSLFLVLLSCLVSVHTAVTGAIRGCVLCGAQAATTHPVIVCHSRSCHAVLSSSTDCMA
jgi:hypothetical protein